MISVRVLGLECGCRVWGLQTDLKPAEYVPFLRALQYSCATIYPEAVLKLFRPCLRAFIPNPRVTIKELQERPAAFSNSRWHSFRLGFRI